MKVKATIIDDNDNPKATYELEPSKIYEDGISTKYVFKFEYNELNYENYNKYKIESEKSRQAIKHIFKNGDI